MEFTTPKGTKLVIIDLKGKDYLPVQQRIIWFREEKPGWSITTELVSITDKFALAKAYIKDESGRVVSTSHKSDTVQAGDFFIEKAETGAIGRALALVGYGTQFCGDELDEGESIADAPVGGKKEEKKENKKVEAKVGDNPKCECGKKMMVSKFNESEWYCFSCKNKKPRILEAGESPMANLPEDEGKRFTKDDIPF